VNPRAHQSEEMIIQGMRNELNVAIEPVGWLPGFYYLPEEIKIANCGAYVSGSIYGIDVSSGVAVHALEVCPSDHVLDLCCAPGGKMSLINDIQGDGDEVTGSITGVDVSRSRLGTCKSVLRKYKMRRARLFVADGSTFNVLAPSRVGKWQRSAVDPLSNTFAKPFLVTRLLAGDPQLFSTSLLYDKVLVDVSRFVTSENVKTYQPLNTNKRPSVLMMAP
jgi:16S rRNA C967 or C1407 C5-methylase (RsmB/RsmF family)